MFEASESEWRWCLVGNIVQEHRYSENGEIRLGTKHFAPGAKVYCAPGQWGDGYEQIVVIGSPRHGKRFIEIVMPFKKIEEFRIQKVFNPLLLKMMQDSQYEWWENNESDYENIMRMLQSMKSCGVKVKEPL